MSRNGDCNFETIATHHRYRFSIITPREPRASCLSLTKLPSRRQFTRPLSGFQQATVMGRTRRVDLCVLLPWLVPAPSRGKYAVPFGDDFACVNPDRDYELLGDDDPGWTAKGKLEVRMPKSETKASLIPEAKADAKGVSGLVVLQQVLAVAGKVLHLNRRAEFTQHRHVGQVKPQIV